MIFALIEGERSQSAQKACLHDKYRRCKIVWTFTKMTNPKNPLPSLFARLPILVWCVHGPKPHPEGISRRQPEPHPEGISRRQPKPHPEGISRRQPEPHPEGISRRQPKPHPEGISRRQPKPHPEGISRRQRLRRPSNAGRLGLSVTDNWANDNKERWKIDNRLHNFST